MEVLQKAVPFPSVTVCNTEHLDVMVAERIRRLFTPEEGGSNPVEAAFVVDVDIVVVH